MIEIPDMPMTIREAAELTGLSEDTLRYYERIDLLPPAERKSNGHRFYTAEQVQGIIFMTRLKSTGMTLEEMKAFRALISQGESTLEQRKTILRQQHEHISSEIRRLKDVQEVLEYKLNHYDRLSTNPQVEDMGCELSDPYREQ
ncbi:MerR family transcriptional regulator [Paenibacillus bovis]|uniref:MerR family transcriptional regulator n=1 Tax=Paenibacillus bovis TaxID=1616788 RepID=A0A172ZHN1_9BACL|nr:MerR family transcriptional regulator [Paenibacillus bovis]ANF97154.1 MerR family transcriptional regulator [Paenibacillus bovis]